MDRIQDVDGIWQSGDHNVRHTFERYFLNIFTSNGLWDMGHVLNCVDKVVTAEMNESLLNLISLQEVKDIAMEMGSTKAPRSDGVQGLFNHNFWEQIHNEVNGPAED